MDKGLIHIYTGDGKGKTTAAIGLSVRALGNGYKVIFTQFLKSATTGEVAGLKNLGAEIFRSLVPKGFTWELKPDEIEKVKTTQDDFFKFIIEKYQNDKKTIIVFDEIITAVDKNLIDINLVLEFLKNKPIELEVVMTGRNASDELIKIADYVSNIQKVKHPSDSGIRARSGIEM